MNDDQVRTIFQLRGFAIEPRKPLTIPGPFWWVECYGCGKIHPIDKPTDMPKGWHKLYPVVVNGNVHTRARDEAGEAPDVYSSHECLKRAVHRAQTETPGFFIYVSKGCEDGVR